MSPLSHTRKISMCLRHRGKNVPHSWDFFLLFLPSFLLFVFLRPHLLYLSCSILCILLHLILILSFFCLLQQTEPFSLLVSTHSVFHHHLKFCIPWQEKRRCRDLWKEGDMEARDIQFCYLTSSSSSLFHLLLENWFEIHYLTYWGWRRREATRHKKSRMKKKRERKDRKESLPEMFSHTSSSHFMSFSFFIFRLKNFWQKQILVKTSSITNLSLVSQRIHYISGGRERETMR